MTSLTLGRALTARIATRFLRLATFIILGLFVAVLLTCGLLAYFFSAWWWLLIIPFVILLAIFMVLRLFIGLVIRRIHSERLSPAQADAMDGFTDKIQALLEARATPPWMFVAICIKDLVLHRDITTVKSIVNSTATLKRDYQELEKLF